MTITTGRDTKTAKSRKRPAEGLENIPYPKQPRVEGKTDRSRWRLKDDESRHTWHYLKDDEAAKEWPQSYADKYYMNLPLVRNWHTPLCAPTNNLLPRTFPPCPPLRVHWTRQRMD